jgi:ribosomal protein S18 acetylase RimI-like enzyme
MAAVSEAHLGEVVDLRQVDADELEPILEEEICEWRQQLDWDFQPSADLVRRFVNMQSLNGYALVAEGRPVGYCYFVCEERKGLIGDLYFSKEHRSIKNENRLLGAVLENLMHTPQVHRIESQLMLLRSPFSRSLPNQELLSIHRRNFMAIEGALLANLKPGRAAGRMLVEKWSEHRQEAGAQLIAAAYEGHIDGQINDQYRSVAGARRFLTNVVQYPGCGTFFEPASYVAFESTTDRLCGLSLASRLASDVGHITQICVAPHVKGTGIGYELLRRSLESLARSGCRKTSLTVTAANTEAIQLYERVGFETIRSFAAFVWRGS